MIVKISSRGSSFKGLATYLTHDPKAETAERVGWTHTLNLANDHVPSAVDEMLWTARAAELLKQEAGIRAGGRVAENTVLHASLNWSPDDKPTREHMIETAENFLQHMGWDDRQAILVAHTDKSFSHVHLMVNSIHPETGLCLDDSFEQRRSQAWALEYEKQQERIYCEQRLLNANEREDGPTRPAWMAFKNQEKEFENDEKLLRENNPDNKNNPENPNDAAWKKLKAFQREERESFFTEGKSEFSELRKSVYREVREEYRENWADYYAARKDGADDETLASMKAGLVAEQKAMLEEKRDAACKELRETRDVRYRELLDDQRDIRHGLRNRQEAGLENALFFEALEDRNARADILAEFRENARAVTTPREMTEDDDLFMPFVAGHAPADIRGGSGMKHESNVAANVSIGLGLGVFSIAESIVDGLIWSKPDPKPRYVDPEPPGPNPFELAIDETRKRQQREQEEEAGEEWRKKQRSYGE